MMEIHEAKGIPEYGYSNSEQGCAHAYLLPAIEKALSDALSLGKGTNMIKIFDAGCGNGVVASYLYKKGYEMAGCDASVEGIEQARKACPEGDFQVMSVYENMTAHFGNGWDVVLSSEVIEHLYYPRTFVHNLTNLLKTGGLLIITTPYHGYLKNLLLALSGSMDKHFTALWDGGHIKFWSSKTLQALLNECGFTDFTFLNAGRIPWLWKSLVVSAIKS